MGDAAGYREALLSFLDESDEIHAARPSWGANAHFADKALTYIRLARLERGGGNSQAADDYERDAVSNCENAGWGLYCATDCLVRISEYMEHEHGAAHGPTDYSDLASNLSGFTKGP